MMERNHGHIVTIASLAGYIGVNKLVDYCSTKFAAVGFDDALKSELSADGYDGIHTTCICPFYINTGMFDGVQSKFVPMLEQEYVSEQIINAILTNEDTVYLPRSMYVVVFLNILFPKKSTSVVNKLVGVHKAMSSFKGRQSSSIQSDNHQSTT